MQTLGLLFIVGSLLLGRQVVVGRAKETPEDIRDITLALLSGDFDQLREILSQRGENVSPDVSSVVAGGTSGEAGITGLLTQTITGDLLATMVKLGSRAKGYVWGATGPDNYDCSGLVWAALKELGYYNGGRFTTATFTRALGNKVQQVNSPVIGDIVLWPGKHIGVVSGPDQMYSAMSRRKGIGYTSISESFADVPSYYRLSAIASSGIDGNATSKSLGGN